MTEAASTFDVRRRSSTTEASIGLSTTEEQFAAVIGRLLAERWRGNCPDPSDDEREPSKGRPSGKNVT